MPRRRLGSGTSLCLCHPGLFVTFVPGRFPLFVAPAAGGRAIESEKALTWCRKSWLITARISAVPNVRDGMIVIHRD